MEHDYVDIELVNGLILSNCFLPEEIITKVLSFVSWKDLLCCRLVCHVWRKLIDSVVGLHKLKMTVSKDVLNNSFISPFKTIKTCDVPFFLCFAIAHNAFGKNHLKNSFGEDNPQFKHWTVIQSRGDGWIVEKEPAGSQPLPDSLCGKSCFTTSYGRCIKEQCITLKECGLNNKIMDEVRPHISVSEWYAKRFDCGIIYILRVFLLDEEKKVVEHFYTEVKDQFGDNDWHQLSHTFKEYGSGVRYVLFQHEGKDTQFWAGHYGSKMTGGAVVARISTSSAAESGGPLGHSAPGLQMLGAPQGPVNPVTVFEDLKFSSK